MTSRVRRVGLVGGLVVALMLLATAPAAAADMEASGWWWRVQSGTGGITFPPPPGTPSDGIAVGSSADGATAVAAVRFRLVASEIPTMLTLVVASETGSQPAIRACLAGSPWSPAQTGRWDDRPAAACGLAYVDGQRSADGTRWSFAVGPLASLVTERTLDIVMVPTPSGSSPQPTFHTSFNKPASGSLASTVPEPPPPPPSVVSEEPVFEPPPPALEEIVPAITGQVLLQEPAASEEPVPPPTPPRALVQTTTRDVFDAPITSRIFLFAVLIFATIHLLVAAGRSRAGGRAV